MDLERLLFGCICFILKPMQEKLRILAENRVLVSAGVVVIFVCSVVYFLYALGFIKDPGGKAVVDSSATNLPVKNTSGELSDPSTGSQTALELNSALKKQQAQQTTTNSQKVPPLPTASAVKVTPSVTPKVTPSVTPTLTLTPTPTQKPADPTATPTPTPTEAQTTPSPTVTSEVTPT
jgi:hypothetical protein